MAAVVDIAKTELRTYSPLNEKHNILYNRIRHIINERHVKRPWFDLNPLIDCRQDKDVDLDGYKPDNNIDFRQLESLAIIEDYFSEKPVMTREFSISDFWHYMNSGDWADGYSIRVLEGRLQNLILTTIASLIQTDAVVQHSTVAYAKSRRRRQPIYKHSHKAIEVSGDTETLLLEFIYYGHAVRPFIETETSSLGYPGNTTTTLSSFSEELESSDVDKDDQRVRVLPPHPPPAADVDSLPCRQPRLQQRNTRGFARRRGRNVPTGSHKPLSNKPLSRIREEESRAFTRAGIQASVSNTFSEGEWQYVPPTVDLGKFMCTEKVSYLGEFELPDDSSSDSDANGDDDHYGQEYYLGETRLGRCGTGESVTAKLKKRKEVVTKEREVRRRQLAEFGRPVQSMMPEFSEFDINKYLSNWELKASNSQTVDIVPDLFEFINMMRQDERPRLTEHAKLKQRCGNKNGKRFTVIRPENEQFGDYVGGVTDSTPCKLHCYSQRDSTWRELKQTTKKDYMIKKLLAAGGNVQVKPKKKKKKEVKKSRELQIPYIYITTVIGITYLHPDSKPILRSKGEGRKKEGAQSVTRRCRTSLVPMSPTTLSKEIKKSRRASVSRSSQESPTERLGSSPLTNHTRKFPKANDISTLVETTDFESDDESDTALDISPFDTKRLNIRYSIERIRSKKSAKKKKTATFHNVLKKYCRMQSILKAFSPCTPGGKRRMAITGQPGLKPMHRLRKTLPMVTPVETTKAQTVGKLRWFAFLDARTKLQPPSGSDDSDLPLFDNYSMELFRQNLVQALQDFVVRREVVISDVSAKASVSVTFTRKMVFTKSNRLGC